MRLALAKGLEAMLGLARVGRTHECSVNGLRFGVDDPREANVNVSSDCSSILAL